MVSLSESGPECQATGNTPHRLMKEPGMTGLQTADEIVDSELERTGIFQSQDPFSPFPSNAGPVDSVELWVEIFLLNRRDGLIEDSRSLSEA